MKHFVSSPTSESTEIKQCKNVTITRKAIDLQLLELSNIDYTSIGIQSVRLLRKENIVIDSKKINSSSKKYGTIPDAFLSYYPKIGHENKQ